MENSKKKITGGSIYPLLRKCTTDNNNNLWLTITIFFLKTIVFEFFLLKIYALFAKRYVEAIHRNHLVRER